MNKDVVTFLYHEVSDDPDSTGFVRKSSLPYKHKKEEFIKNIEAIKIKNRVYYTSGYYREINKPYLVEFAMSITSSSVLNGIMDTTGPNISS